MMRLLSWTSLLSIAVIGLLLAHDSAPNLSPHPADDSACQFWVAPPPAGDDENPGTFTRPWATMEHAAEQAPDNSCIIWFKDGRYTNANSLTRRFVTQTAFKAVTPYRAIFEREGTVVELDGVYNMLFEGFVFRHSGPEAAKHVVIMDRRDGDIWSENVIFRNNIFHDSYNNDLLKIHNGVRHVTVEGNLFYNQGASDQHIDVNSVTDIAIQDNIFFNDFEGSGRALELDTKHYIVIKDSNDGDDSLFGSRRIVVRRNVFLNWEGEDATFVQVGNDGKPYYEAIDVEVVNNLMIGNAPHQMTAAFGVRGARDVIFANNTVTGDLPAKAYAMWVSITEQNLPNENLRFANNIWSDATGSMGVDLEGGSGEFSDGDANDSNNVLLQRNLYWNGGQPIPPGEIFSPLQDDTQRIVANPLLNTDQRDVVLPRWAGDAFLSGAETIRQEFERLVWQYGAIAASSPAVDQALTQYAPHDDILGNRRDGGPDLGAFEAMSDRPPGDYRLFLSVIRSDAVNGRRLPAPGFCRQRAAIQSCHEPRRR